MSLKSENVFKMNMFVWKIFGLWPESKCTKVYSFISLLITTIVYDTLLTINLVFTPKQLDLFINEILFMFKIVTVIFKILMILIKKENIVAVFKIFDSQTFEPDDIQSKEIIQKHIKYFNMYWKIDMMLSNFSYLAVVFFPLLINLIFGRTVKLPISSYYFLGDDYREKYFGVWYFYQSFGAYVNTMCNLSAHSFIAGIIIMLIAHTKVLNYKLRNLKIRNQDLLEESHVQDEIFISLSKLYLKEYGVIMECYTKIQDILSLIMFVQFTMTSAIICVTLYGLSLGITTGLLTCLIAIALQIFVPSWLGTQFGHECNELAVAAYNCDWTPRSEECKTIIKLFILKANATVVLTGLKMFPLSLETFVSIMKSAYSFFALLQNVQDRQ